MLYPKGTFTGDYPASDLSLLAKADYGIAHEFGTPAKDTFGVSNRAIAEYILAHFRYLPVYAAPPIAGVLHDIDPTYHLAGVLNFNSADTLALSGGTWQELHDAKRSAGDTGDKVSIHFAQAFHAGRVAEQAKRAGMHPLLPPGLPTVFDPTSTQWWCRSRAFWIPRELIGVPILRLRKQF